MKVLVGSYDQIGIWTWMHTKKCVILFPSVSLIYELIPSHFRSQNLTYLLDELGSTESELHHLSHLSLLIKYLLIGYIFKVK